MDRDLLVGILAWRRGWVAHDALLAAIEELGRRPDGSVAAILVERRALTAGQREELVKAAEEEPTQIRAQVDKLAATDIAWVALKQSIATLAGPRVEATLSLFDDGPIVAELDERPVSVGPGVVVEGSARFEVVRLHARGGLGEVHLARELGVPREVALKEIQPQYARDGECRRRFVCEAEVTGSLEHPGIVPVYALGKHADGRPFYVMRFIAGETLRDAISDYHHAEDAAQRDPAARELAFRKLLDRYLDICQTIAYAHSRGVLHRDLKPDNVMLGAYGETLVVDWGLAKRFDIDRYSPRDHRIQLKDAPVGTPTVLDPPPTPNTPPQATPATPNAGQPPLPGDKTVAPDATRLGTIIGTPAYMSPEQALGWHDRLGPPADVFSLGAILYVILTGRPAAAGTSVQEVLQKAQTCEFLKPSTLFAQTPPALEAICLKAMSKAATDRYATAAELAADVEAYLADQPVTAWAEPWHVTAGRWIRRHRAWAIGIGAGGGVLVACLLLGLVLLSSFNEQLRTERDRATTNFELAQSAVNRYLVRVSNDRRLRAEGLESLRRDLLRDAGEFYEKFIEREGKQADLQFDLARAHYNLGTITAEIDSTREGAKKMEQALVIQEELSSREPANEAFIEFGADVRNDLANLLVQVGERERAVELYLAAEKAVAGLPPSSDPAQARVRALTLGRGQHNLGLVYHYMDRRAEARAAYNRAARELGGTVDLQALEPAGTRETTSPQILLSAASLASNARELGILEQEEGHLEAAAAQYEQARQIFDALVRSAARESEYRTDLAGVYINLASLAQERHLWEAGLRNCDAGLALVLPLRQRHPEIDLYHSLEGKLVDTRAMLLWRSGRNDEALAAIGEANRIRRDLARRRPEHYEYRMELAGSLTNETVIRLAVGKLDPIPALMAEAIELHRDLASGKQQPSEHRYRLAKDHDHLGAYHALVGDLPAALHEREAARTESERLVGEFPAVPYYREFLLGVLTNYANTANRLRRFDLARAALADAEKHALEFVRRSPDNLNAGRTLARVYFVQGQTAGEDEKPEEAVAHLRKAVQQRRALVERHPMVAELKKDLAAARFEMARAFSNAMQKPEAETEYTAAVDLYRELLAEPATAFDAEYRLAQAVYNRGILRWTVAEEDAAVADLEEAVRIGVKLLAEREATLDLVVDAAAGRGLLARFKTAQKKPAEALPHLNAAIDLLWPHRQKLASFPLGGVTLRHALVQRAEWRVAEGEFAPAADDYGRAAEMSSGQAQIDMQFNRLQCLNAAGEHAGAIAGAEAMDKEHHANHEVRWMLALGCAIASAAAEKDAQLSPADRTIWAEQYAAQALAFLEQLSAAGELTAARRALLQTDPRFEALRKQGKLAKWIGAGA